MHTPCVVCSASAPTAIKATARRSTRATLSRLGPDPKSKSEQSDIEKQNFRQRYFKEEYCYVMDAKSKGNIGRYLNVSSVYSVCFVCYYQMCSLPFRWCEFERRYSLNTVLCCVCLQHSCDPNVFVQNVFVDSHDLRFPWVAFFAGRCVRACTQ